MKKLITPPINMKGQKIFSVEEASIVLHDNHLVYRVKADAETLRDEDDEILGWKKSIIDFELAIRKSSICALEKSCTEHNQWCVLITSTSEDIVKVYTKEENASTKLYQEVYDWLFK